MSSWKKVKRSGCFRRKVQKERDEMMKKAMEIAEEFRKKGKLLNFVIVEHKQLYCDPR